MVSFLIVSYILLKASLTLSLFFVPPWAISLLPPPLPSDADATTFNKLPASNLSVRSFATMQRKFVWSSRVEATSIMALPNRPFKLSAKSRNSF
ncbi:hypothetical protein MBAV_004506 [Candidatus Magnetobacterium bavaricum]|uniref:Uncharacterized protein n=1 Tax=Candidatus Magnetobacterium bavaricum TaxID=29290 RepID=A0A0F3GNC1_9BACT|nr:hypothetical protein MBAV_004506 [Candidatus Magnetobacterium bavaricum]